MDVGHYIKKFDTVNLICLGLVWWNLNSSMDYKFHEFDGKLHDIDNRLTRIETILLLENRLPSHVANEILEKKHNGS